MIKRLNRSDEILNYNKKNKPTDLVDIINVLGDAANKEYPFYRNGTEPDNIATIATAFFISKIRK